MEPITNQDIVDTINDITEEINFIKNVYSRYPGKVSSGRIPQLKNQLAGLMEDLAESLDILTEDAREYEREQMLQQDTEKWASIHQLKRERNNK